MTVQTLAEKVEQMRNAQKKYFTMAGRVSASQKRIMLDYSRRQEKELDEMVQQILHPVNTKQTSMFIS